MSQIETINQFLSNSTQYEKKHSNFRQNKERMFPLKSEQGTPHGQIEQKGKLKQSLKIIESQSDMDVISKGMLKNIQLNNYIIKATSMNQVDQILNSSNTGFQKIIAVDFSGIRMTTISEKFPKVFTSIQILNLQNNLICELPQSIHSLELIQLNLNNNLLKQIQIQQPWIRTMERLDIGKNHIRFLPESLYEMNRLNILDVRIQYFFSKINCKPQELIGLNMTSNIIIKIVSEPLLLIKYNKIGQDILANRQLEVFWEVILDILTIKQTEYIQCYDFLEFYNSRISPKDEKSESEEEDEEGQPLLIRTIQVHGQESQQLSQPQDLDQSGQTFEYLQKSHMKIHLLHYAVLNEDLGILRTLIDNDLSLSSQLDEDNHTALSLAIQEEKYHCAKILLTAGVDINIGGGPFGSCLNIAIIKVQYFLIRDLINFKNGKADINKQDRSGNSALHHLVPIFRKNKMEAAKIGQLLLDAGAEPNLFNDSGYTPLQLAIKKGSYNAIEFFLTYNSQQKSQCFSLKLLTPSLCSSMHLAAISECVSIILLIFRLYPFQLFVYNNRDQRPIDIIQKNFTLSKIFQAMEVAFIQKNILGKIPTCKDQEKPQVFAPAPQVMIVRQSISSSLNDSDDNGDSIKRGMALMNLQPKLKKSQHQLSGFLSRQDSNSIKFKDANKVPSEKANVSNVTRSIQQDRNDINKIEQYNKQFKNQIKSFENKQKVYNNKYIHKTLQQIRSIQKDLEFQKDQMVKINKLTLILLFEKLLNQLEMMKNDPIIKNMIDNALELYNFGNDKNITELITKEKEKLLQQQFNILEQEQIMNFGQSNYLKINLDNEQSFIQYEFLQRQKRM